MKKKIGIILLIVEFFAIIGGIAAYIGFLNGMEKSFEKPVHEYEAYKEGQYCYVNVYQIQDYAAYYNEYPHGAYYVSYDKRLSPTLIYVKDSDFWMYEELLSYTYDKTEEEPEYVSAIGNAVPISEALKIHACNSINAFWKQETVTQETFKEFFGEYFVDTTGFRYEYQAANVLMIYLAVLFLLIGMTLIVMKNTKKTPDKNAIFLLSAVIAPLIAPLAGVIMYYIQLNQSVMGYFSVWEAFLAYPQYIVNHTGFSLRLLIMILGVLVSALLLTVYIVRSKRRKEVDKGEPQPEEPQSGEPQSEEF